MKLILTTLLFVSSYFFAQAQDTIYLKNPSFEGIPTEGEMNSKLPKEWYDCGFPQMSPPDLHPVRNGEFRVVKPPNDGHTYIGMVTRDNDTWERMGTKLSSPVRGGNCYAFSISLARSEIYLSYSLAAMNNGGQPQKANYVKPIVLRIYGGNLPCERKELISTTQAIKNTRWLKYDFQIQPEEDYKYLIFEAFYVTPTLKPYNGNILLDNASSIVKISCEGVTAIASVDEEMSAAYEKEKALRQARRDSIAFAKKQDQIQTAADFSVLVAQTKLSGNAIKFKAVSGELDDKKFSVTEKEYTPETGLNRLFELIKANPKLSLLIGVKNNGGKKIQNERMEKLTALVRNAELTTDHVLIRKFKKVKKLTKWDAKNDDLAFYVFEPEG